MTTDTRPRIDVNDEADVQQWARRFDASPEQIHEAIEAVGDKADEVELHLKGTRASTNAAQEERAEGR